MRAQFACGPDVEQHLRAVRRYADADVDRLVPQNAGPDPDGFMDFFQCEPAPALGDLRR